MLATKIVTKHINFVLQNFFEIATVARNPIKKRPIKNEKVDKSTPSIGSCWA